MKEHMKDREYLMWLHARLEHIHRESPNFDYMRKLRSIIYNTSDQTDTHNEGWCTNDIKELKNILYSRFHRPCSTNCCKCNSDDIHRKYWRAGEDTHGRLPCNRWPTTEWVDRSDKFHKPALKDCITHHCRCCGYEWDSDVMPNESTGERR
jgi:hypothetical protein